MPLSCISLHQLPFPDFLTVGRSSVTAEAAVRRFNLITMQLGSPERGRPTLLPFVHHGPNSYSAAILVTHVKFSMVNYSCTPSFTFPLPRSCLLQPKQTGLL